MLLRVKQEDPQHVVLHGFLEARSSAQALA